MASPNGRSTDVRGGVPSADLPTRRLPTEPHGGDCDSGDSDDDIPPPVSVVRRDRCKDFGRFLCRKPKDEPEFLPLEEARLAARCNGLPPFLRFLFLFPDDTFRVLWDFAVLSIILYIAIVTPLKLAFSSHLSHMAFDVADVAFDIFFLFDILLNFTTAVEKNTFYLVSLNHIRYNYMASPMGLPLDALSSVPFSVILWAAGDSTSIGSNVESSAHANKGLKLFRIAKLMRVLKVMQKSSAIERVTDLFPLGPTIMRLIQLILGLCFMWHWLGCFYWLISESLIVVEGIKNDGWVPAEQIMVNGTFELQYTTAFFWALVVCTGVGYDIEPQTPSQYAFTTTCIILGLLIFSTVVGSVASIFANMDLVAKKQREQKEFVRGYLEKKGVPPNVTRRLMHYFRYLNESNSSQTDFELPELLKHFPPSLQVDIRFALYSDMLRKIPVFRNIDTDCMTMVVTLLRPRVFLPGDFVVDGCNGHGGTVEYFLAEGTCEVLDDEGGAVLDTVERLHSVSAKSGQIVRAARFCLMLALSRDDIKFVMERFPDQFEHSSKYHEGGVNFMDTVTSPQSRWSQLRRSSASFKIQRKGSLRATNVQVKDDRFGTDVCMTAGMKHGILMDNVAQLRRRAQQEVIQRSGPPSPELRSSKQLDLPSSNLLLHSILSKLEEAAATATSAANAAAASAATASSAAEESKRHGSSTVSEDVSSLRCQLLDMQALLQQKSDRIVDLESEIANLQSNVKNKQEDNDRLRAEVSSLRALSDNSVQHSSVGLALVGDI